MPKTTVAVRLVGQDGNAFSIIARVKKALERAGHQDLAKEYVEEAKLGDYNRLLQVTMSYVKVE